MMGKLKERLDNKDNTTKLKVSLALPYQGDSRPTRRPRLAAWRWARGAKHSLTQRGSNNSSSNSGSNSNSRN